MSKLISIGRTMAAQENCNGPEYNMIQDLADALDLAENNLKETKRKLKTRNEQFRKLRYQVRDSMLG